MESPGNIQIPVKKKLDINQNLTNPGYQCTKDINQYYLILIPIQSKSSLTDNYSLLTNNYSVLSDQSIGCFDKLQLIF